METGKFHKEEFSEEELTALGEAEKDDTATSTKTVAKEEGTGKTQEDTETEDKKEEESEEKESTETEQKVEPTAEELAAAEEEGFQIEKDEKTGKQYIVDEDGARIPPKRFKEVFYEAKEGQRTKEKFDLFKKLGPEGYYTAYPDERPEDFGKEEPKGDLPIIEDIGSMIVTQPDGPYDGMTLREVYEKDPVFAGNLQANYLFEQREAERQRKDAEERTRSDSQAEVETFAAGIAKELFDKAPDALSQVEEGQVGDTINLVIEWMTKTHRGGGIVSDAYTLMVKEGLIKSVNKKASMKAINDLTGKRGPGSIDTSHGGDVKATGFEAYEKMSEDDLTKAIDAMPDPKLAKFLKEAPKSMRSKHPGIPWD